MVHLRARISFSEQPIPASGEPLQTSLRSSHLQLDLTSFELDYSSSNGGKVSFKFSRANSLSVRVLGEIKSWNLQ